MFRKEAMHRVFCLTLYDCTEGLVVFHYRARHMREAKKAVEQEQMRDCKSRYGESIYWLKWKILFCMSCCNFFYPKGALEKSIAVALLRESCEVFHSASSALGGI